MPDKATRGQPIMFFADRQRAAPVLYLWPTPDRVYTFAYWRQKAFRDVGTMVDHLDIPVRFTNVLIAGVAYYLSLTRADVSPEVRATVKQAFAEETTEMLAEDRDRTPLSISIDLSGYYR
jgi:hypothetical protein